MRILGSVSPKAVVDIQWDNALCGQQVHDRGWHSASEPLKMWLCSFPHSPHLSSCEHSTNGYQVAPGIICSWLLGIQTKYPWPQSQEIHGGGGRGEGEPGCPSTPRPPPCRPSSDAHLSWPPLTDPLFFPLNSPGLTFSPAWQLMFSNVLVWALPLAGNALISGTVPNPSVPCSPSPQHSARTWQKHNRYMLDCVLPHQDGAVISGYFVLLYSQCYLRPCGLWILNSLNIVIASCSLCEGRVATCLQSSDFETWGLMCVSDVPLWLVYWRRWHVCDTLGAVPDFCQYERCVSHLCLPLKPTLPPNFPSPLSTLLMHIPDL